MDSTGKHISVRDLPERIAYLILMYLHGELTQEQRAELDSWMKNSEDRVRLFNKAVDFFE